MFNCRTLAFVTFVALVPGCSVLPKSAAQRRNEQAAAAQQETILLQREVMSLADGLVSALGDATLQFGDLDVSPQTRFEAMTWRLSQSNAAITIAAGPSPRLNLIECTILITLGKILLEDHWSERWGEVGETLSEIYRKQEVEAWELTAQHFSPDEREELRALITEWREKNPEQLIPAQAHFASFADLRGPAASAGSSPSGVLGLLKLDPLAHLDPATREITQTRYLAERAMYQIQRMPILLRWGVESLYSGFLVRSEFVETLELIGGFHDINASIARTLEGLPEQISREREEILQQIRSAVAEERKALVQDLETTAPALNELAVNLNTLVHSTDEFLSRWDRPEPPPGEPPPAVVEERPEQERRPFDILEYATTATELANTAKELTVMVNSLNETLNSPGYERTLPAMDQTLKQVEASAERLLGQTFRLGVALLIVGFVVVLSGVVIHLRWLRRLAAHRAPGERP